MAFRIESECNTPGTIGGLEAEFLHIRMPRSIQRIGMRAAQMRTEFLQQPDHGRQFDLGAVWPVRELVLERFVKID